jgi:hypothetical protein
MPGSEDLQEQDDDDPDHDQERRGSYAAEGDNRARAGGISQRSRLSWRRRVRRIRLGRIMIRLNRRMWCLAWYGGREDRIGDR